MYKYLYGHRPKVMRDHATHKVDCGVGHKVERVFTHQRGDRLDTARSQQRLDAEARASMAIEW